MVTSEIAEQISTELADGKGNPALVLREMRAADIADVLNYLSVTQAAEILTLLSTKKIIPVLTQPSFNRRNLILEHVDTGVAAKLLNAVPADQRTDIVQRMSPHQCRKLLPKLTDAARKEIEQLLKYPPESAGGIMTTELIRLSPTMLVSDALEHIRSIGNQREFIYSCYVIDPTRGRLLGTLSLRDLVVAKPEQPIAAVMRKHPVTVKVLDDRSEVVRKISHYNLLAIPVLETDGTVVGFVTVDDVIDVLVDEETEDILRMNAIDTGALDVGYANASFFELLRKRASWLVLLFIGELLTATAMGYFESEISKAVVLALFVPLIISSGGNSGSQAATLIIRAMALGEIALSDWKKVLKREILSGLTLGVVLGTIGFARIGVWSLISPIYGPHWFLVGLTVFFSLIGVVTWGTISGSMLPFVLKRCGADPATSSAPFVATLVDVTGLVIYFTMAMVIMRGVLL